VSKGALKRIRKSKEKKEKTDVWKMQAKVDHDARSCPNNVVD
jgi:hypothetical protein